MGRRKPRSLRPDEAELWSRVASTAQPLHPRSLVETPGIEKGTEPATRHIPETPKADLSGLRIGKNAREPAGDKRTAPAGDRFHRPLGMDARTFQRIKRGKRNPEAKIDLHGLTLADSRPRLTSFILMSQETGRRLVLVITGKGRDTDETDPIPQRRRLLRHEVPRWLSLPPLSPVVLQFSEAHQRHGGGGALYVYLRRAGK